MKVGRYEVDREIAVGGMATVHLGRLVSDLGLGRVVAVKRLHRHAAADPDFVSMFLDEARLAARVRHSNVVSVLDLVSDQSGGTNELYMVLEYVEGETLSKLVATAASAGEPIADRIVAAVMAGALHGLHAAHEARAEDGTPLGIVHRDFTPQNVIVGTDGVPRVADFGVAKAVVRLQHTREGQLKGKLGYIAPEQLRPSAPPDRRADVFSAGVVLWELLARRRLFRGDNEGQIVIQILTGAIDPPSDHVPGLDSRWDDIVERAVALSAERRYPTARAMAEAIEATFPCASASEVGAWVSTMAAPALALRAGWVAELEQKHAAWEPPSLSAPLGPVTTERAPATAGGLRTLATAGIVAVAIAAAAALAVLRFGAPGGKANEPRAGAAPLDSSAPIAAVSAEATEPAPAEPAPASGVPAATAAPQHAPQRPPPARARAAPRPSETPTAKPSCRYYDQQEKIWKFRVECYQ